jgi:cell shape-determining protein MreC
LTWSYIYLAYNPRKNLAACVCVSCSACPSLGSVAVGSPIISAGGATSLAPPDIVIGTVSRVVKRTGTLGPILEVKLSANLNNLNFVRVLLYQPITERPATP